MLTESRELQAKFEELRKAYPGSRLLIVSNTAGTASDPGGREAEILEKNTGVRVFRHNVKVRTRLRAASDAPSHRESGPGTGESLTERALSETRMSSGDLGVFPQ